MARFVTYLFLFSLLFALLATLPRSFAQDTDGEIDIDDIDGDDDISVDEDEIELSEEDLQSAFGDYELIAHPAIETYVHFPNYPAKVNADGTEERYKFPAGEDVVVYVGFRNSYDNIYFNVSLVGAQLHSPFDFDYYIQNFTRRELDAIVGPNAETTVEYRFRPDSNLEPLEFQLSGWLIYNGSDGRIYQSTFINTTIELLEHREPWSFTRVVGTIIVFAVLGGLGYGSVVLAQSGKPTKRRRKTENAPAAAPVEWTSDAIYKPSAKATAFGKKSSRKSSSKKDKSVQSK